MRMSSAGPRYPIRANSTFSSPVRLAPRGLSRGATFGSQMALSASGDVALVGAPGMDHDRGAAWVFVRSGSQWGRGIRLSGLGERGTGLFGSGVALSADGRTAFVGAAGDDGFRGAVYVFRRTRSGWVQRGARLTASGEAGESGLGYSLAVSSDGGTLLAGGPFDRPIGRPGLGVDSGYGAAWVFVLRGGGWRQQGDKLTGAGEARGGDFGGTVALSGDGRTALVGAVYSGHFGGAWVFTTRGTRWTAGPRLAGTGTSKTQVGFGAAVALSQNGDTAAVGGSLYRNAVGAVWVFTRAGGRWQQQVGPFSPTDETGRAVFGDAVALNAAGNRMLIGGSRDDRQHGASWLFRRDGDRWVQAGAKLTAPVVLGRNPLYGSTVAFSANATTALIGGGYEDNTKGAAWAYAVSS
jgi:hypothetical protein